MSDGFDLGVFIGGISSVIIFMSIFMSATSTDVPDAPQTHKFYEHLDGRKISEINLITNSKNETYYLFTDNGKEVRIKKQ